jgi:serine/threonine protein kinase/Flp pilus assembly protein TadD
VKTTDKRACPSCGTLFPDNSETCPVCALRGALNADAELSSSPDTSADLRFEHYQILRNEDGTPMELGRGAMGITYKAFDVHLQCPVALKIINAQLIGDSSARHRFVREARAAASVRHSNVASVFHLGETGGNYFYVMEFVDGETLEQLIRRSGKLESAVALEIATQVAAGLVAIHKQHLVHRDIKPSNIMVSWDQDRLENVKIIDLGLAKGAAEEHSISTLGSFVGTPEYASPEQFAGIGTDIRSDLYSLGVTLWEMLSGQLPFEGSAAQLMYEHQHAVPPIDKLKGVPSPINALLEILLAKDPGQRFQSSTDLQKALSRVRGALVSSSRLSAKDLRADDQLAKQSPKGTLRKYALRWLIASGLCLLGLLLAWYFLFGHLSDNRQNTGAVPVEKSIAVLPFENISANKDDAYFADGIQDDLLTDLAKISALKVISRTSVMQYRAEDRRNLRNIGNALGVANLLEGTIRKEGNRVRISTRLIRANTAETLWAESYDRDLIDIFAIQSEIAQTIADRLRAKLSPSEKKTIWERPTDDLVAYDLYLQAKATATFLAIGDQREDMFKQVSLLTEATRRDPGFVLAYCLLARANDFLYVLFYDHTPERRKQAEAAVNRAMQLRPDTPEPRLALAHHLMVVDGDYERARTQIAIAQQFAPNNALAFVLLAELDEKEGRWNDAPKNLEKAVDLDPRNLDILTRLEKTYSLMRRYQDCKRVWTRIFELAPDDQNLRLMRDISLWGEKGDPNLLREALALPYTATNSDAIGVRFDLAICGRDWVAAEETLRSFGREEFPVGEHYAYFVPRSFGEGLIARFQSDEQRAKEQFSQARARLQQNVTEYPDDWPSLSYLGLAEAFLGDKEDAIRRGREAVEMTQLPKHVASYVRLNLAAIYAWSGEPDQAVEVLTGMMGKPVSPRYGELKLNPIWGPIRDHPRFQKLLEETYPK